jgi:riboflavin synthase
MFSGIIADIGTVQELHPSAKDLRMRIGTRLTSSTSLKLGDSIAVNGACLTVTDLPGDGFYADVSAETLSRTNLGQLKLNSPVNLETALTLNTALGGHLVSGHIDAIGVITEISSIGQSVQLSITAPLSIFKYIAAKGSITVDGVSLTVNTVNEPVFTVNIIPHTLENTIFKDYRKGTQVNLETDLIARYIERLLPSGLGQTK